MYCPKCGRQFEKGETYCANCGEGIPNISSHKSDSLDHSISEESDLSEGIAKRMEETNFSLRPKKKTSKLLILITIAVVILAAAVVYRFTLSSDVQVQQHEIGHGEEDPNILPSDYSSVPLLDLVHFETFLENREDYENRWVGFYNSYGHAIQMITGAMNDDSNKTENDISILVAYNGDETFCNSAPIRTVVKEDAEKIANGNAYLMYGYMIPPSESGPSIINCFVVDPENFDLYDFDPSLFAVKSENATDSSFPSGHLITNYVQYEGSFAVTSNAEEQITIGGPSVDLYLDGDYLFYSVYSQQKDYLRVAYLEGLFYMDGSDTIHFDGKDSWSNSVIGTIYLLDNGNVAVESIVTEYAPDSMWSLNIPYVELVPCLSDPIDNSNRLSSTYLYPSDSQYITEWELNQYTRDEIVLIRNEIYARYGYNFSDADIRAYFESQSWYHPIDGVNSSTFDSSIFNDYESTNIDTILAYERKMGWR